MVKKKSARWHTIYSIVSTVIEEIGLAAAAIWVLPLFDIRIPPGILLLILMAFAVFSYVMYLIGHPTVSYKEVSSPDSIIGSIGVVESKLDPEGLIKLRGELWKAVIEEGQLNKGEEVTVTGMDGLTLFVKKKL